MKLKFFLFIVLLIFNSQNSTIANNTNYYDINYSLNDLKKIKKLWIYSSGVFKDSQTKLAQYEDKIIHLDGKKNLIVINLLDGSEICKNIGKPDRAPYRGINLYIKNASKNEVFAVFPRHNEIKLINIFDCNEKIISKKIKQKNLSAPILIYKHKAILLPNGETPISYDLNTGEVLWKVTIEQKDKENLTTLLMPLRINI